MTADLTVLLVLGPHDAGEDVRATVASIRADAGPETPVAVLSSGLAGPARARVLDLPVVDAAEVLQGSTYLAFARAGDRWRPGALAARLRPLAGHPDAVLGVAGHALIDAHGAELRVVASPLPGADPVELALRPSIELSSVLVRTAVLTPTALALVPRPGGDVVLWSRIVRDHGLLPSLEVAADVPVDRAVSADEGAVREVALDAARILWEETVPAAGPSALDRELLAAHQELIRLGGEIAIRDAKIARRDAEIARRDAHIARVEGVPIAAVAVSLAGEPSA